MITIGRIVACHGLKGWLKVNSFSQPRAQILDYPEWVVNGQTIGAFEGAVQGKKILVRFASDADRTDAEKWVGHDISIRREWMQPPEAGHHYWCDLLGLEVVNLEGESFGEVTGLMETGANDVLIVKGQREELIPFVRDEVIRAVDLDARRIVVDWQALDA